MNSIAWIERVQHLTARDRLEAMTYLIGYLSALVSDKQYEQAVDAALGFVERHPSP